MNTSKTRIGFVSTGVTLLSVCEDSEGTFLLVVEGCTVPGEVLEIGNTNSRYSFPCGIRSFFDQWCKAGPSHHCAVGIGHRADELRKLAFLTEIRIVEFFTGCKKLSDSTTEYKGEMLVNQEIPSKKHNGRQGARQSKG